MINNVFPTILIGGLLFFCFGKVSKRAIVLLVGFSSRGSFRQSAGCFIPGEDNLVVLGVPGGVFVMMLWKVGQSAAMACRWKTWRQWINLLIWYDVVVEIYHDVK